MCALDPIAAWLCEELGVIFPDNPTGSVTDLLNDEVLDRLANCIRVRLGKVQLLEQQRALLRLRGPRRVE